MTDERLAAIAAAHYEHLGPALVELFAEVRRARRAAEHYERALREIEESIDGELPFADGEAGRVLEELSHQISSAWCCGEYETGSGQHLEGCAHG